MGWKPPFSCLCSQNMMHWRRFVRHACQTESMPFVKSKFPLPTSRLRFLRAAARSASSGLWLLHAHPFLAAAEKNQSHAEKRRVWSRSCGVQDLLQFPDCALMWLLQAFSLRGLEAGLPAFQLPTFAKRDALPKGDFSYMFVSGIQAFCEI